MRLIFIHRLFNVILFRCLYNAVRMTQLDLMIDGVIEMRSVFQCGMSISCLILIFNDWVFTVEDFMLLNS
jgi:hypothetical protein